MPPHQLLIVSSELVKLLFVFSLGACVGSLTNVLAYRMPLGLNVVTPSSRCPKCSTKLRWNDNVPILGWIALRGRCRFCRVRISPEYPIVELIGALLFAAPFLLFFTMPQLKYAGLETQWLGIEWAMLAPEWADIGRELLHAWPILLVDLVLLGCLLPATIIDARTFMIPLILTWIPAIVAVVVLPITAAWHESLQAARGRPFAWADGWTWAIATPGPAGWKWVGGSIGAVVGLGVSLVLVRVGLLKQSFADYDEWEQKAIAEMEGKDGKSGDERHSVEATRTEPATKTDAADAANESAQESPSSSPAADEGPSGYGRGIVAVAIVLVCGVVGGFIAVALGFIAFGGVVAGLLVGPILAGAADRLRSSARDEDDQDESPATMWLAYPHARRETIRELAFLGVPALLGLSGWMLAGRLAGPWTMHPTTFQQVPAIPVPLWLDVLAGVLVGYLVGGGIVWAVRIFGTLSFGKEAMGLGDVHLMAGVGACLGWIDPTLAFFLAAFVAIYMTIVGIVWAGEGRRAMPFGPALVVATILVFLGKAGVEQGINAWLGRTGPHQIDLP